jgi:hypothetical protein
MLRCKNNITCPSNGQINCELQEYLLRKMYKEQITISYSYRITHIINALIEA